MLFYFGKDMLYLKLWSIGVVKFELKTFLSKFRSLLSTEDLLAGEFVLWKEVIFA